MAAAADCLPRGEEGLVLLTGYNLHQTQASGASQHTVTLSVCLCIREKERESAKEKETGRESKWQMENERVNGWIEERILAISQ